MIHYVSLIQTIHVSYLEKCEFGSDANNLWPTINSLTNRKTQDSNADISFEGTIISDKKKIAKQFNRQFKPHSTTVSKDKRHAIYRGIS